MSGSAIGNEYLLRGNGAPTHTYPDLVILSNLLISIDFIPALAYYVLTALAVFWFALFLKYLNTKNIIMKLRIDPK